MTTAPQQPTTNTPINIPRVKKALLDRTRVPKEIDVILGDRGKKVPFINKYTGSYTGPQFDVGEAAKQDVLKQKIPISPMQVMQDFNNRVKNKVDINGKFYNAPEYDRLDINNQDRFDQAFYDQELNKYRSVVQPRSVQDVLKDRLIVPFSSDNFKETIIPNRMNGQVLPEGVKDYLTEQVKNSQELAQLFSSDPNIALVPVKGQQMLVNMLLSGDLSTEMGKAFRDVPGDIGRFFTFAGSKVAETAGAAWRTAVSGKGEGNTTRERFVNNFYEMQEFTRPISFNVQGFMDAALASTTLSRFNDKYKDMYMKYYNISEDQFNEDHKNYNLPAVEIIDEGLSSERSDFVRDIQYEPFSFNLNLAAKILDLQYNKLDTSEKSLTFFASQAPFTAFLVMNGTRKGVNYIKQVMDELEVDSKRSKPKHTGKSIYEVYQSMQQDTKGAKIKSFGGKIAEKNYNNKENLI